MRAQLFNDSEASLDALLTNSGQGLKLSWLPFPLPGGLIPCCASAHQHERAAWLLEGVSTRLSHARAVVRRVCAPPCWRIGSREKTSEDSRTAVRCAPSQTSASAITTVPRAITTLDGMVLARTTIYTSGSLRTAVILSLLAKVYVYAPPASHTQALCWTRFFRSRLYWSRTLCSAVSFRPACQLSMRPPPSLHARRSSSALAPSCPMQGRRSPPC